MAADERTVLALDVGSVRVGMALANDIAKLPQPMGTLPNDANIFDRLSELCKRERVRHVVIGLPRGLDGQDTRQTELVRQFATVLATKLHLPYSWQDEALTSVQAEAELQARRKPYAKQDVDALAATYILGDYLHAAI